MRSCLAPVFLAKLDVILDESLRRLASQPRRPRRWRPAFPNSAVLAREMNIPPVDPRKERLGAAGLRAGLILIALSWGFNWPAVKLALNEMPIWSMRAVGLSTGGLLLLGLAKASGRSLQVTARQWPALMLAGLLNVTAFNVLTAVAQTLMPTSRAVILAYTMPLWTALLARLCLGERLPPRRQLALGLGAAGLVARSEERRVGRGGRARWGRGRAAYGQSE